jgi:hypothetical protein
MKHSFTRAVRLASVLFLAHAGLAAVAVPCTAETASISRADELFQQGKSSLAAGDLPHACAALSESFHLDPATGSLLALAHCHERQGKRLSAIAEYQEVVGRAVRENRTDRARAARLRVIALEHNIPTAKIFLTRTEDLEDGDIEIRLNGAVLRMDQLGAVLPIDGDAVDLEVIAVDKQTWRATFPVTSGSQPLSITIPALEDSIVEESDDEEDVVRPAVAPRWNVDTERPPPLPKKPIPDTGRGGKITGLSLMGVGAVGLLVGGGFTLRAARLNQDSRQECDGNLCTEAGRSTRLSAREAGNVATISVASGAAVALTGALTYALSRPSTRTGERRSERARLKGSAWVGAEGAGAVLHGSF